MEAIRELNKFFFPYKWMILIGIITIVLSNLFYVAYPYFIRQMVNTVLLMSETLLSPHNESFISILFYDELGQQLGFTLLMILFFSVLSGINSVYTRRTIIVSSHKIVRDIRNKVFNKLLVLPQKFYDQFGMGDIYIRITKDVNVIRTYYGPITMYMFNLGFRSVMIISMMFSVNVEFSLWSLSVFPFVGLFAFFCSHYVYHRSRKVQEKYSDVANNVHDIFSNILIVKAYVLEKYNQKKFYRVSKLYKQEKLKLDLLESIFHPTAVFLSGISLTLIVWNGGQKVIAGELSLGHIAEFIIYVLSLTWPFVSLGNIISQYQQAKASWERVKVILDYEEEQSIELKDISNEKITHFSQAIDRHGIQFEKVWFTFPNSDKQVLKNIHFSVERNQSIGFVGRIGSGKSTLVSLLMGLYRPTSGRILVGNVDIVGIEPNLLRRVISYVAQDHFLFSTSIRENIKVGYENITDEKIEKISRHASLYDNVMQFENKFDTHLGERGINLSGGQKQRLSIARSFANPFAKICVFDDAFSAIDSVTEKNILKSIQTSYQSKIHIFVAHRISNVIHCDKIFLLNNGSIESEGSHEELMTQSSSYADLYRQQLAYNEGKEK